MDRRRNATFMLLPPKGGIMQVGATCLQDYTRDGDAAKMVSLFSLYEGVINDLRAFDDDYARDLTSPPAKGAATPILVLALAACAIQKHGFVSSKKAAESQFADVPLKPTWEYVDDGIYRMGHGADPFDGLLNPTAEHGDRKRDAAELEPFYDTARKTIEWAKEASPADPTNEYLYNLKTLCTAQIATHRDFPTLTSGVGAYERSMVSRKKEQIAKAAPAGSAGHLGNAGDKLWMRLLVTRRGRKEERYGREIKVTHIYGFSTEEGHSLVYFSSRTLYLHDETGNPLSEIKVGEWRWLSFTVKDHSQYKGQPETIITRGDVQPGPRPEKPAKRARAKGKARV